MSKLKDYERSMNNEDSLSYWLRYSVECLINETNETMFEKNCDEVIFKALRLKSVKYEVRDIFTASFFPELRATFFHVL